jgi:hypothetical protein
MNDIGRILSIYKGWVLARRCMCHPKDFGKALTLAPGEPNVRFGSKSDISQRLSDVRFTPESGYCGRLLQCMEL